MCLSHLFCRLLMVSIVSLHVSTTCSISSFVLCSVHGTSISIFQMPQVVEYLLSAESMFRFHTTQHSKQMPLPYVSSSEGWSILTWGLFFCLEPLCPKAVYLLTLWQLLQSLVTKRPRYITNCFFVSRFCPFTVIFIVLPSTIDIFMILVFFMLILMACHHMKFRKGNTYIHWDPNSSVFTIGTSRTHILALL